MAPIRILIADDHPLFRSGIGGLLASIPDMRVVGEAATVEETVRLAAQLQPDVILMDIKMPGESRASDAAGGITATRRILDQRPGTGVLMLTMFEDKESILASLRAGARGYLLKDAAQEEVLRAVRAVAHGEAIFGPEVAAHVAHFLGSEPRQTPWTLYPELSVRERQVMRLIGSGLSNADIAAQLTLSVKTIQNYVSTILNKLHLADRTQIALRARDAGMH